MSPDRLERLLNEHKDAVYRQMVRVCGNKEDAEDALASAVLAALQTRTEIHEDGAFRSWLSTIGTRVCVRMRKHPSFAPILEEIEATEGDGMEMGVLKSCVKEAVDALPAAMRDVYVACEIEEQTLEEVALHLDISVAAAKSRLHRARKLVRDMLDHSVCGS